MSPQLLNIIHFNDVYKMTENRTTQSGKMLPVVDSEGLTSANFDHVVAFSERIKWIRNSWPKAQGTGKYLEPQGLVLFSGDLFSPSVESLLSKGMNMVLLMNELSPDACVPGNHEFDFGRARFNQLVEFCNFPWILSNVQEQTPKDNNEWKTLVGLSDYRILKRAGLKIGLIGLMSQWVLILDAWKATNPLSRENMKLNDMQKTCMELSQKLREDEGCDLVFALTHAEHREDLDLAIDVAAYPADCETIKKANGKLEDLPGVDAIFGGHNHNYYLGKGVNLGDQRGTNPPTIKSNDFDTEEKYNDLLVVKSGFDFNDLSEVIIRVEDRSGKYRKKVITSLKVIRHNRPVDELRSQNIWLESSMSSVLTRQYNNEIMKSLISSVATTDDEIEVNSQETRRQETIIGNWVADAMLGWYQYQQRKLTSDSNTPAPLYIMTGGTVRGDMKLGPGEITRHQMIQLLPFETTLTLLQVEGSVLLEELNGVLTHDPSDPRVRFPVVSGFRVEWDSRIKKKKKEEGKEEGKEEEKAVKKVIIVKETGEDDTELDPKATYPVLTNTYLAEGGSGFKRFKEIKARTTYAEVAMYQALLFYINDLRTAEYQKRLEKSKSVSDGVQAAINIMKDLFEVKSDGYDWLEQLMKDAVVNVLESAPESSPLPRIEFKAKLGRIKDVSAS
ncbi:unnamed protein product [Rhizoctonia solani]|uniref:5'-nucleotidase n=1 Tax=Rhizoctonia solani TaxID=456999 RepID=A0A8H2WXV0_9AGAM|nr:unnamed protein product [Rhizoctonia solani]